VKIGISFGVAIFPDDAEDMESLCIAADLRMYENKRKGALAEPEQDADRPNGKKAGKSEANPRDMGR
jgi:GGDEF domain-containing protein